MSRNLLLVLWNLGLILKSKGMKGTDGKFHLGVKRHGIDILQRLFWLSRGLTTGMK